MKFIKNVSRILLRTAKNINIQFERAHKMTTNVEEK